MNRIKLINGFIRASKANCAYLEIGYGHGECFENIICPRKEVVDPNLKKPYPYYHSQFSSDFFRSNEGKKWDIIFIDGSHYAEHVYEDICNSYKYINSGGTILVHDCCPPTWEHTRDGGVDGCWNGTVYKAYVAFTQANKDNIDFYTINSDWGIGVIKVRDLSKALSPVTLGYEIKHNALDDKDFWNFFWENRKELLSLRDYEEGDYRNT